MGDQGTDATETYQEATLGLRRSLQPLNVLRTPPGCSDQKPPVRWSRRASEVQAWHQWMLESVDAESINKAVSPYNCFLSAF